MINGGRQLEQHKADMEVAIGDTSYKLYKEGKLEAEYDRVIGTSFYKALCEKQFIIPDTTIPDVFKELNIHQ